MLFVPDWKQKATAVQTPVKEQWKVKEEEEKKVQMKISNQPNAIFKI